jgi:nucleotide-binding universal stress UspA family protein
LVLITPRHRAGPEANMTEQRRCIVVGVDFETCGDDAILQGLSMLERGWATEMHGVHVLDPSTVIDDPEMPALFTEERVLDDAPRIMRDRIEELALSAGMGLPGPALQCHARIGRPGAALEQVAADYDADVLVVGSHRRRGFDRMLLGSIAEDLVRRAHCPVLVARPKDHSSVVKSERPDPAYAPGEAPAPRSEPADHPLHISTEQRSEGAPGFRIF